MADTDFDDTDYATEAPLPTPGGTPYRTPQMSRRPSRGPTPSPSPSPYPHSSSPPPMPSHGRQSPPDRRRMSVNHGHMHGHDGHFDENISILDPRRFTPTLHANLVAEILSLRRELESKNNFIDTLEHDLATVRNEQENAASSAATALKEARDMKRQLARVERDDAAGAVAQERDEAVEALAELKKQVERLTTSRRKAEEDLQRMKKIQERDYENFDDTKRALERRAHVAEGRLKAVLDEISAYNAEPPTPSRSHHQRSKSEDQGHYSDHGGSDTASIRTMSLRHRPMSLLMGDDEAEKLGISMEGQAGNGLSLADELEFDAESESEEVETEEEGDHTEMEGEETVHHENLHTDVELDEDNDEPADMISDAESVDDIDELPEVADMGIQVQPAINYEETIADLEHLLEEKSSELEQTYAALDQKSADLEQVYTELDHTNNQLDDANHKVMELEDRLSNMDVTAAESFKALQEREFAYARDMKVFEVRQREVDERWTTCEEKSISLDERESTLNKLGTHLDQREKGLDEREKALDDRQKTVDEQVMAHAEEVAKSRDKSDEQLSHVRAKAIEYEANIARKRSAGVTSPPPQPISIAPPRRASILQPAVVLVDSQMQTVEEPPSPPKTPPPPEPKVVMKTTGVQTDPIKKEPPIPIYVPGIIVSPPEPTPPLPIPPKPIMRNASAQTRPVGRRTHSMQTEEIKLDERLKRIAPHLIPTTYSTKPTAEEKGKGKEESPAPTAAPTEPERPPPNVPRRSSKRTMKRSSTAPTPAPTSAPISAVITSPPRYSDASLSGSALIYGSPTTEQKLSGDFPDRTKKDSLPRHLFGSADATNDITHSSGEDDGFPDEGDSGSEYKTALSAPRPRRQRNSNSMKYPSPVLEKPFERYEPPRKQPSMRKSAMVSSGVQAHRARSPSLNSNRTTESGGTMAKPGPPFPVPMRHSSRRPGYLSDRDRANSPTPRMRGSGARHRQQGGHGRQQSIRKVRSAAALPSTRDGNRTRSPPPLSTSTAAPDSPELPPPLPRDEIASPAFDRSRFGQSRHRHHASNNTSTTGQASVGSSVQQTSVVDAIAQTMVGEWMWKYVRRRKSFGVESPQPDVESGGQRHKRWVWLAPYERAVMWSSRQPTSGSALLGKSGRKRKRTILHPFGGSQRSFSDVRDRVLTNKVLIQSVLDVKDETPLPKGASPGQPVFNRSILILTPARALKFTASSRERHYVWLTALSFLSHSADGNDGLLSLPPPMPFEYEQVQQSHHNHDRHGYHHHHAPPALPPPPIPAKSNAFSHSRDSVRLAKGKTRAAQAAAAAAATNGVVPRNASIDSRESFGAEPPSIPRFPGHSRRRSNSAMRPQTRSTSHGYERSMASVSYAPSNPDSINGGDSLYGVGGVGITSGNSSISHGMSSHGGWDSGPMMGTVRMEAFVERKPRYEFDEQDELESRPSSYRLRRDRRSSRHESYWSGSGSFYNGEDATDEFFRSDDPFRGF